MRVTMQKLTPNCRNRRITAAAPSRDH